MSGLKIKGECQIRIMITEDGRVQTMFNARNISISDVIYGMELLKHDWIEKSQKSPDAVPGFSPKHL